MKPIHLGALTLLGAIWGASFIFIGVAAHAFGPLPLMAVRVTIAALALLAYTAYLRNIPNIRQHWKEFLIVGTLNAALPFTLIAFSQLTLTASLAAILNSTTPLFTALVAAVWISEKLTLQKIGGIIMGIIGVMILVGGSPLDMSGELIIAVLASLGAALCYGLGTVYASRVTKGMKPMHAAIGQLLGASAALAIPAMTQIPQEAPEPLAIAALLALALLSTSFAYQLYFYLLGNVGPTRTATVTFLVPVFGTIWGVIFLQDPLSIGMIMGMAVILASVGLVIGIQPRKLKPA